ncbi:MAG: rRNA adenine N-6-methyltransferase family protein [Candidatus Pacearchaeota archaeon]
MSKIIEKDLDKGQHFLIDSDVIKKQISVADISKKDRIIEIGAGGGNLTSELIKKAGKVLAFEIDKKYKKKLNHLEKNNKNLQIIYGNAIDYSWKGYTKIVSNIPYFMSEQIINKAIEDEIPELTLIVGEKFKDKLLNKKPSKIGIISNIFYFIDAIMKVDKKCFSPPPKVNSWLIRMNKKKEISNTESLLASILRKKGKLKNAIIYSLVEKGKTKREAKDLIKKINLNQPSLEKPMSRTTWRLLVRLINELENLNL